MRLLTLETNGALEDFVNGERVDEFQALDVRVSLIHAFLVSEEINYDTGHVKLVFDLDRHQEVPNFSSTFEVV